MANQNEIIEKIKDHLTWYKHERLGVELRGSYSRREYSHILPKSIYKQNILETYRKEFWEYFDQRKIELHTYFHHLNSSQAMLFNLVFPFLHEDQGILFLKALGLEEDGFLSGEFEVVLNQEEQTHFDMAIQTESGKLILFEAKYSEAEFGKAKKDVRHSAKKFLIYDEKLKGIIDDNLLGNDEWFFENYQVLRNLAYINDNPARPEAKNHIVFLVPAFNPYFKDYRDYLFNNILKNEYRKYVSYVFLEDLVSTLRDLNLPPRLQTHMELFQEKYLAFF